MLLISEDRISIGPDAAENRKFTFTDIEAEESFFAMAAQCFGEPLYLRTGSES